MQTFAQELSALRKERGITQEQLAQALSVSRTTVSRWESGKALPDIETVRQLSRLLNHNFFSPEDPEDAPVVSESPVEEPIPAAKEPPRPRPGWRIAAVCGLCLILLAGVLLLRGGAAVPESSPTPTATATPIHTPSPTATDAPATAVPEKASAEIVITPSQKVAYVDIIAVDDGREVYGWRVDYRFENRSDVPFTLEKIEGRHYEGEKLVDVLTARYADLRPHMKHDKLYREDGPLEWSFATDHMNITHCVVTVYGRDDAGNRIQVSERVDYSLKSADEAYGPY